MSYFDRSYRGRYVHPFDEMMDSFNRFNESFYNFSESMNPRYQMMQERQRMERLPQTERVERIEDKGVEKKQLQTMGERESERRMQTRQEHPMMADLLERPMKDVLKMFEDPFYRSNWESHSTVDRAHKLLGEMISKGKPDIKLAKDDEMLKIPEEFQDVYRELGSKGDSKVTGTSYQTSNITKDGKTVTVVRKSKLNPDGSITTKVSQHFDDGEGHRDTKTRKKKINYKTGEVKEKIMDMPKEKKECLKCEECKKPVVSKEESMRKDEVTIEDEDEEKERLLKKNH